MRGRFFSLYILVGLILTAIFPIITSAFHGSDMVVSASSAEKAQGEGKLVYVIPIEREVERGLEAFITRTTEEAEEANADHIIFEIDTPGGRVDSAGEIASILQDIDIPTASFVVNNAFSAGSYIALNTDTIYMKPHATMGASGVITGDGSAADKKAQSAWLAQMEAAAKSNGRDPQYAAAMADKDIDMPEYNAGKGEFLTLDADEAVEVGYSEGTVDHRVALLDELGLSDAVIEETDPTASEEIARFLTNPVVIPILLSIASIGLITEVFSPGFGIPGTLGVVSLLLFFYGHFIAGLAGMETIILVVVGFGLIIAEFFVSGGILGIIGVGSVITALFMSGYDVGQMTISISIALITAIVTAVVLYKYVGFEKGIFKHLVLRDSTAAELGYVANTSRLELIGLEGETVTQLRPAGVAQFDEERLDVVSEGGFVERGQRVRIVQAEGARIVVREIE